VEGEVLMPLPRRCNIRILEETSFTFRSVRRSLPQPANASISRALRAAQNAASAGRCAEMHQHAQSARAVLDSRLDMLLGRR
jgi:hypothetical protein